MKGAYQVTAMAAVALASCSLVAGLDKDYHTVACLDDCPDAATSTPEASAPDAAASKFCATVDAGLCWSFDEAPFLNGPGLVTRGPSRDVTTTANMPKSAPYALAVSYTTNAAVGAGLDHEQTEKRAHVRCDVDIRVDAVGANDIIILELHGAGEPTNRINLVQQGDSINFRLATIQSAPPLHSLGLYPLGKWLHVSLDVDAQKLVSTAAVEQLSQPVPLESDAGAWDVNSVTLGITTTNPPSTWQLSFDNFYCTGL
jgi:hypothetical protein